MASTSSRDKALIRPSLEFTNGSCQLQVGVKPPHTQLVNRLFQEIEAMRVSFRQELEQKDIVITGLQQKDDDNQQQLAEKAISIANLMQMLEETRQSLEQKNAYIAALEQTAKEVRQRLQQNDISILERAQAIEEIQKQLATQSANFQTAVAALDASEAARRSLSAQLELSPEFRRTEQADGRCLLARSLVPFRR